MFQRLIQKVISGLNPTDGGEFVGAYLDDTSHLDHQRIVLDRLLSVNLKLKCKFLHKEEGYFGHVVTSSGLRPNDRLTEVIQGFPRPCWSCVQVPRVSVLLGRIIPGFAKIVHALHGPTTNLLTGHPHVEMRSVQARLSPSTSVSQF